MENTEKSTGKSTADTLVFNQYQYTDVLMEEVQNGRARQSYMNFIPLIIITLVCAFFTWREFSTHKTVLAVLFALIGIGCLLTMIAVLVSTINRKKAAIKEFHDTYHGKGFEYKITIEGSQIRAFRNNVQSIDIRRSDIRGSFETERFYIFLLSGEQLLPLKKGAFIKGNLDNCRNYIPKEKK